MKQSYIIATPISANESIKIENDLEFIRRLTDVAKTENIRVIISGGYAVDGLLGKITRPHRDIDVQLYSKDILNEGLIAELIIESLDSESSSSQVTISNEGRMPYSHYFKVIRNGFLVDIHYIQVLDNPFARKKSVIMNDNSTSDVQTFNTQKVTLEGVSFEATSAVEELVNKRFRREVRNDVINPSHNQDMDNLCRITNVNEVESKLKAMIKDFKST